MLVNENRKVELRATGQQLAVLGMALESQGVSSARVAELRSGAAGRFLVAECVAGDGSRFVILVSGREAEGGTWWWSEGGFQDLHDVGLNLGYQSTEHFMESRGERVFGG